MPQQAIIRPQVISNFMLLVTICFASIQSSGAGVIQDKPAASIPAPYYQLSHELTNPFYFAPDTGGTGGILPLHNFSLSVVLKENMVYLKWLAENEMNTEKFIVQRSTDGAVFTDLTTVLPSGPMNILTTYTGKDDITSFSAPLIYYRVKAQDNRNNYAYSNVVPVRSAKVAEFRCWPNPFNKSLTITYFAQSVTEIEINLVDMKGITVQTVVESVVRGTNQLNLSVSTQVSPGIYMLYLLDRVSGERTALPVVKLK